MTMTYQQIYDRLQDLNPVFLKRVTRGGFITEEEYIGVQFYALQSLRDAYIALAKSRCEIDLDVSYDNHQKAVVIKIPEAK